MSSPAQVAANKANAQFSTGPKTEEGKIASSRNNFHHGLSGAFVIHSTENIDHYTQLLNDLRDEHNPATPTEELLVERMAQHWWLGQRAVLMQELCFHEKVIMVKGGNEQEFALYLRYQTTHERAFSKCLGDLMKLRAELLREDRALEMQRRHQADDRRKQEMHEARLEAVQTKTDLAKAKAEAKPAVIPVAPRPTPSAEAFAHGPLASQIPGFAQRVADAFALDAAREAELQTILQRNAA